MSSFSKILSQFILALALLSSSLFVFATDVEVKGLSKGMAILQVNGQQKVLRVGQTFEGVTLISATSREAVLDINGESHKLGVSRKIATKYKQATKKVVRLAQGRGGHYVTNGLINGRSVKMMVDTGATSVAMSLPQAKALNLNYRSGTPINLNTANGVSQGFKIMLRSVQVGGVKVNNVEAVVNMSDFPDIILLGNSYLSKVNMINQNGVLVLESKL